MCTRVSVCAVIFYFVYLVYEFYNNSSNYMKIYYSLIMTVVRSLTFRLTMYTEVFK